MRAAEPPSGPSADTSPVIASPEYAQQFLGIGDINRSAVAPELIQQADTVPETTFAVLCKQLQRFGADYGLLLLGDVAQMRYYL